MIIDKFLVILIFNLVMNLGYLALVLIFQQILLTESLITD
jgi:hypothetical protein